MMGSFCIRRNMCVALWDAAASDGTACRDVYRMPANVTPWSGLLSGICRPCYMAADCISMKQLYNKGHSFKGHLSEFYALICLALGSRSRLNTLHATPFDAKCPYSSIFFCCFSRTFPANEEALLYSSSQPTTAN